MQKNSLAKNSIFNIIYNISNLLFPIITSMYVARILLPDGVGQVSYAQSIASYFVTFAALGLPTYGVREIAKVRDDKKATDIVFSQLIFINFISTVVCSMAYLFAIFLIPRFRSCLPLFLCCGIQIVLNFLNIDWFYQAKEEYSYIVSRSIFIKAVSLVAVFAFVKSRNDFVIYALISSLACAGNYLFNVINARKYVRIELNYVLSHLSELKLHLIPVLVLAISAFLGTIYSKIDITMLGSMVSDEAAGLYTNAHKLIEIIISICTAISAVFLPRLSYLFKNDKVQFNQMLDLGFKILCFIAIPCTVGVSLLAPNVVKIMYGDAFAQAAFTVRLFSPLIIIKSFGNLFCYQLVIATGNERKRIPAYILAALANIVLNAILIPQFAQNGATIASVVSELIVNILQFFAVVKIVRIPISYKALSQSIISSAAMMLVVKYILTTDINILGQTILSFCLGVLVYSLFNFLLRNEFLYMLVKKVIRRK